MTLERMVHGGYALARLPGGRLALIRGGIPGEVVRSDVHESAGVMRGEVLEILEASPDRVPASDHPGLDTSFASYSRQLSLKREVTLDALRRALRREVVVPEVVPAPSLWRYRSVVQPVVVDGGLGYRVPGSHRTVLLTEDPVAFESVRRAWWIWHDLSPPGGIRELVLRGNDRGEVLAALISTSPGSNLLPFAHELVRAGIDGVAYAPFDPRGRFRGGRSRLAGVRSMRQQYGRFDVTVNSWSFAQPNPEAASGLYRALDDVIPTGEHALDLYAGSGIIGMHLARSYNQVTAVEIDRGSVARGQKDAERLGIDNLIFTRADAKVLDIPPDVDLICCDPPRAGLSKAVRSAIIASACDTLLYISCDVATWARDVAHFEGAGFELALVQPFDFYPHTHHIEVLSLLRR